MRKILCFIIVLALCTAAHGNQEKDPSQSLAISLILDISPSMKHHHINRIALERQIFYGLKPGDYLEIISAHHETSRLRLAQKIQSADAEEIRAISAIAGNIKYADFLDSDVAKAFDTAFSRFDYLASKQRFGKYLFIILTDGQFKGPEAARIESLVEKCRQRNWLVYLTGTYKTNRHILTLAASAKDSLHWSLLHNACPAVWFSEVRQSLAAQKPKTQPIPETIKPITPKPLPVPVPKPKPTEEKINVEPDKLISKPEKPAADIQNIPKTTPAVKPDPQESKPPPLQPKKNPVKPKIKPSTIDVSKSKKFSLSWLWLLLIPLAAFLAAVLRKNLKECENWLKNLRARLPKTHRHKHSEIITAQYNGRIFRLGSRARLKAVHIGSAARNALRIQNDTIADRHLCLYRKKHQLMLRNLARTPIVVNQHPVPPGRKHILMLPATVRLSDSVTLKLDLAQPTSKQIDLEEEV